MKVCVKFSNFKYIQRDVKLNLQIHSGRQFFMCLYCRFEK